MVKWIKAISTVLLCEALLAVLMIGCSSHVNAQNKEGSDLQRVTFRYVSGTDYFDGAIYCCDKTGVLYFVDGGSYSNRFQTTMTMLYKANGRPMTVEDLR